MKTSIIFLVLLAWGVISTPSVYGVELADTMKMFNLDEVTVASSRTNSPLKNLPQRVEVITQEQIGSLPSDNLAEVLKRTANLDVVQYPGVAATVGIRGFSPTAHSRSYTLTLINGLPAGSTNLATVIPSGVERIEIVKGPYSTLYGTDAMGGVINIITQGLPERLSGDVEVEGGSFGYYRASLFAGGAVANNLRAGIGATTIRQGDDYKIGKHNLLHMSDKDKYILDEASYGDRMHNTTFDMSNVRALAEWQVSDRWKASAEAMFTFSNDIEVRGNYWGTYGQTKKEFNRLNLYGTLERKVASHTLTVRPYYTREKEPNYSDNSSVGFVNFESDISEYGLRMQDQFRLNRFTLLSGIDLGVYDYQSDRFEARGVPTAPYKPDNRNSSAAVFAHAAYHSGNLDVNAGVRFDHLRYQIDANEALNALESKATHNVLTPSLGLQYRLGGHSRLHASYGRAFSVPEADKTSGTFDVSVYFPEWDYWWTQSYVGNPQLKPEKSGTFDLGWRYSDANNGLSADITYFNTRHSDRIVEFTLESGAISFRNADRSLMDGLELDLRYNFGTLFGSRFILEGYASCTWLFHDHYTLTLSAASGADSIVKRRLEYVRKVNGTFGVFFRNEAGISARLSARYIGERFELDNFGTLRPGILPEDHATEGGYAVSDNILKHPDYLVFDLSLNYALGRHLDFGCSVTNLLDENYSEKDGYPMQGRQFRVRVGYKF